MPLRHQPPTLRKASMLVIANNFESICYGCHTLEDQHKMLMSDAYLDVEGPFTHLPSAMLEGLLDAVCEMRVLHKKHIHILLQPQLESLNLSFGTGDTLYGLKILPQRCKVCNSANNAQEPPGKQIRFMRERLHFKASLTSSKRLLYCMIVMSAAHPIIEDLAEETKHVTHLRKQHLHLFLTPKLTKWVAHGVGDMLIAFPLLIDRCQNLKQLDISYLRHINPNVLLSLVPRFSSLVSLNLRMTLTVDQMLADIGRNCPQLVDLNLTATPITDRGLVLLCVNENGQRQAQNLVRLIVTETFISSSGATIVLQSLPRLREFDFDQIFDALEKLEKWDAEMEKKLLHGMGVRMTEETAPPPSYLPLVTLFSSAEQVRLSGLDAATRLCLETTTIVLANAWLSSEDLYKFMLFEKLTSLSLTNSEGLTLDFHDGVMPVLVASGKQLHSLILANFTSIDVAAIGRSCKNLRNLALSNIAQYDFFGQLCNEWFTELRALELWSDPQADLNHNMFRQLLYFSVYIQNILFKGCEVLTDKLFTEILEMNPMKKLSHLTIDHCHAITGDTLHTLIDMENDLAVLRIWSCLRVTKNTNSELSRRICDENMDVYLEWFQYEE